VSDHHRRLLRFGTTAVGAFVGAVICAVTVDPETLKLPAITMSAHIIAGAAIYRWLARAALGG